MTGSKSSLSEIKCIKCNTNYYIKSEFIKGYEFLILGGKYCSVYCYLSAIHKRSYNLNDMDIKEINDYLLKYLVKANGMKLANSTDLVPNQLNISQEHTNLPELISIEVQTEEIEVQTTTATVQTMELQTSNIEVQTTALQTSNTEILFLDISQVYPKLEMDRSISPQTCRSESTQSSLSISTEVETDEISISQEVNEYLTHINATACVNVHMAENIIQLIEQDTAIENKKEKEREILSHFTTECESEDEDDWYYSADAMQEDTSVTIDQILSSLSVELKDRSDKKIHTKCEEEGDIIQALHDSRIQYQIDQQRIAEEILQTEMAVALSLQISTVTEDVVTIVENKAKTVTFQDQAVSTSSKQYTNEQVVSQVTQRQSYDKKKASSKIPIISPFDAKIEEHKNILINMKEILQHCTNKGIIMILERYEIAIIELEEHKTETSVYARLDRAAFHRRKLEEFIKK